MLGQKRGSPHCLGRPEGCVLSFVIWGRRSLGTVSDPFWNRSTTLPEPFRNLSKTVRRSGTVSERFQNGSRTVVILRRWNRTVPTSTIGIVTPLQKALCHVDVLNQEAPETTTFRVRTNLPEAQSCRVACQIDVDVIAVKTDADRLKRRRFEPWPVKKTSFYKMASF